MKKGQIILTFILMISFFTGFVSADLIPTSPLNNNLINFFIALTITLTLELLIALVYSSAKKIPKKILLYVAIANLISLPIVWFTFPLLTNLEFLAILIVEGFAFIFEAFFIYLFNKKIINLGGSFLLSFFINLTSLFGGFFLYMLISILVR